MASFYLEYRLISFFIHSFLSLQDGSHRFECHSEVDILSIGDTSLDAAAVVCLRRDLTVDSLEHIVLL